MVETIERLEVRAQVSVPISNIVMLGSEAPSSVDFDELQKISELVVRAYCFEAIFRVLLPLNRQPRWAVSDFLQSRFVDGRLDLSRLEVSQDRILRRYNIESNGDLISFQVGDCSVSVQFVKLDLERGSIFSSFSLRVFVPDTKSVSSAVLASLIASALISPVPDWPSWKIILSSDRGPHYVCTINTNVDNTEEAMVYGKLDDVVSDAISDMRTESDDDVPLSVWKSRQACLIAAGFDAGPVDGVYGRKTRAAEEAYSFHHGGIEVDWSSRVFIRDLLWNAYRHKKSERMILRKDRRGRSVVGGR